MLEVKHTPALYHFKSIIGQVDHCLITILVGLEGVRTGAVTKGETFNVKWNPKSIEDSVKISRRFARNSALSWAIDSLDAYLGFIKQKPFQIDDPVLLGKLEDRSVYKKFNAVITSLGFETDFPISLIHLGIQWRNNLVHYHAENELDHQYSTYLRNTDKKDIEKRFRGLDTILMLKNFNENNALTFKEVAGIIQSIHFFVCELDKIFVKSFSASDFCERIVKANSKAIIPLLKTPAELQERKLLRYFITQGFATAQSISNQKNFISYETLHKICTEKALKNGR